MDLPLASGFILFFSGIIAATLTYYSVALQRLNSAQIERLLRLQQKNASFHGMKMHFVVLGIRLSGLCFELIFLINLAALLFKNAFTVQSMIIFVLAGLLYEIISRIYLTASLPLWTREKLSRFEISIFLVFSYLFYPLSCLVYWISGRTLNAFYPQTADERISIAEETIKSIINVGEEEGIFKEDDGELLQSIVDFSETIVREVMTPRIDLQCIEINQSLDDLIRLVIDSGYSKIPAYRDRIDNIVGVLYAKDVLKFWNSKNRDVKLEEFARAAYFVPETKKVQNLLREFQKEKMHLAMVVDEYGGVAGLVTIEDLLEEIVGEIHDEYDTEMEMIRKLGKSAWLVDAKMDLDELTEIIDVEFPEESYETVGGFMFDQLGRIPEPGEEINYKNLRIEVKEANERRILKVIIHIEAQEHEEFETTKIDDEREIE